MKNKFKKILSTLLCVTVLMNTVFACSVFAANSSSETELNKNQIDKIKADIEELYTDEEDKADAFLVSVGLGERWLNSFTKEYKTNIYRTADSVGVTNEYFVESSDGTIRNVTEKEYNTQKNKTDKTVSSRSIDSGTEEETDSYFNKKLVWIGTQDNSGYYAVIATFEWLTAPLNRFEDVIFLSASSGTFDSSRSGCSMQYVQTTNNQGTLSTRTITKEFDQNDSDNILRGTNYVGYKFNLPNDIPTSTYSILNTNFAFMIAAGYYVQNPSQITNFSLLATYFHKVIGVLFSFSVDTSASGSISISGELRYKKYVVDKTLTYRPQ